MVSKEVVGQKKLWRVLFLLCVFSQTPYDDIIPFGTVFEVIYFFLKFGQLHAGRFLCNVAFDFSDLFF